MQPITLNEPFRAVFYAPFYVAEARGLFAAQGVEVRRDTAGDPSKAAENLLAGRADIAWSGPMRPMMLRDRDPSCPLRSFCAVVMKDPFLLVGRGPNPGFTLADLSRLRFGAVTEVPTPWWCLQDDLRRAGIDPATLNLAPGRPMAENAAAVAAGTLDVAQVFEPHAALLEAKGGAVWHRAADRGPSAYTAFYATEQRIAERSTEFEAMIRAMAEALAWIVQALPEEIAAAIAPSFPDVPRAALTTALARYQALELWSPTPHFPRAAFEQLRGAMTTAGILKGVPDFDTCVDEAIVARALGA
ncbi:ABC transporter substrate-binding protein [Roseomonas eburnea]|uniref:ABC transporter substrate-binding protein n=1 Tax=Neoroseomonas eburnea TaxID=1346889 RepID=A0A9X9X6E7_9PROT|nr:ABC transporter substrate-binding protein [Neoroseomonas eburnea]MBR0679283.1 ABC transporter substrate-binding protein [Neoroseomonas eburnea]